MVQFIIGPEGFQQTFTVHKNLFCNKVPYFDKIFIGDFKETRMQGAIFPEDSIESFKLLIAYIYLDTIDVYLPIDITEAFDLRSDDQLVDLFALAERLKMDRLADSVVHLLAEHIEARNRYKRLREATIMQVDSVASLTRLPTQYKPLMEGSKLRSFLAPLIIQIQMLLKRSKREDAKGTKALERLVKEYDQFRQIYVERSTLEYFSISKGGPKFTELVCDYHQHGPDKTCPYISDSESLSTLFINNHKLKVNSSQRAPRVVTDS